MIQRFPLECASLWSGRFQDPRVQIPYWVQNLALLEEDDEAAAALSTSAGVGPSNSAAAAGTSNAAVQEI